MIYILIIYLFGFLYIPKTLLNKTEPEKLKSKDYIIFNGQQSYMKCLLYFFVFNWICFLFLNKIREMRKIDYYKDVIDSWNKSYGFENLHDQTKLDYIRISRYIKIKKLK